MKARLAALALACLVSWSTLPARAEEGSAPAEGGKVWATMGLRPEGPEERFRVGLKMHAIVEDPGNLSRRGVTARKNDKVLVTVTGRDTFSLLHESSGRTSKFRFDAQGNVTAVR